MSTLMRKRTAARAGGPTAKRLKRLERQVNTNKGELKFITGAFTNVSSGNITGQISQGIAKDERVGDTISIKKVEVHVSTNPNSRMRIALYSPVDPGAGATGLCFTTGGATDYFTQFIDTNEFRVWSDKVITERLDDTGTGTTFGPRELLQVRKAFSIPMKVKYRDSGGGPYMNPVRFQAMHQDSNGTANDMDTNFVVTYKCWYLDN